MSVYTITLVVVIVVYRLVHGAFLTSVQICTGEKDALLFS